MTAQRYTDPGALARMERGLCPECGKGIELHTGAGIPGRCTLREDGVAARIGQYREDKAAGLALVEGARVAAALRPFGWTCGPEFWQRYHEDPWVFNLANAVERLTGDNARLRAELEEKRR